MIDIEAIDNQISSQLATGASQKDVAAYLERIFWNNPEARKVDADASSASRANTIAKRKAAMVAMIEDLDVMGLDHIEKMMAEYIDEMATIPVPDVPKQLTPKQILVLAEEHLRRRTIAELMEARNDYIREIIFNHMDATRPGENGAVPVPQLGIVFKREGCGRTDPTIDPNKVIEILKIYGIDKSEFFKTIAVPATTREEFSEELLFALAAKRPEILQAIVPAIKPGKDKTPRFNVRPWNPDTE